MSIGNMKYYNCENKEVKTNQKNLAREIAKNFSESPQAIT